MDVVVKLHRNGNLQIAGQLFTTTPGIDSSELIDDIYLLDDIHVFNTTDDVSVFISYLFDLIIYQTTINYFKIDSSGNLSISQLSESGDKISINNDHSLTLTGTLTQNVSF